MTVDPTNHPLWTGQEVEVENKGRVARFYAQFGESESKDTSGKDGQAEPKKQ
eukprot:CAMPEP_0114237562 /NCGR_PEP_ID=MMETSP0058-20121206/7458_1 /TAXON_ID=36894 /ORGANISM="Pyramimonas parkeae, CCMP726" /LENGTH=51 /DNA_ID=CAMNT_0001349615 /DNA_START=172 /DNA_END=327 /DNA_ORIENTATION=+